MSPRSPKTPPPTVRRRAWTNRKLFLAALLAAVTLAVYARTWWYGALSFDDTTYVVDNYHVTTGLTARNIVWSFTSIYDANWIPLTWLSLMLDHDMYQGRPQGYHVTNTLLHAACAVLLFLALAQATGNELRSAFVAALFALHPLHVESVAWIAERKDVLSIFFGLLSLWAYVLYATAGKWSWLALAFLALAFSLMAKQTLVTLPFVFLLLDFWPLGRMRFARLEAATAEPTTGRPASLSRLIWEKVHFLALIAGFSAVVVFAQAHGGAVVALPFHIRLMNAVLVYGIYLWETVFPFNLTVYYPHPGFRLGLAPVIVAFSCLLAVTAIAVFCRRRFPYLFVGWFWYLGTLVPMIGIVQVGGQQMADRYTYFPLIGIFLAATWLVANWALVKQLGPRFLPATAVAIAALFAAISFHQLGYWYDTVTLLTHTVAIMPEHPTPHEYLGGAYLYAGQPAKALPELETAIRLAPPYAPLQNKLAEALEKVGRQNEALEHFQSSLAIDEKSAQTHNDFAVLLMDLHQDPLAKRHLDRALELDPNLANAQSNMSLLCAKTRDYAGAIVHGERALELDPKQIDCYHYIAVALRGEGRFDEAIDRLEQLLKVAPDYQVARKELEITRVMKSRRRQQATSGGG
jgi:tetratricopeptide (TPR) repeat protein